VNTGPIRELVPSRRNSPPIVVYPYDHGPDGLDFVEKSAPASYLPVRSPSSVVAALPEQAANAEEGRATGLGNWPPASGLAKVPEAVVFGVPTA
jgi:hypothetical protein